MLIVESVSFIKIKEIWWNWKKEESVHNENMCCSKGIMLFNESISLL